MDQGTKNAIATAARLQQQKNYPAAEQIYQQILRVQPKNSDALLLLGLLLHETGRNEPAVELLRRSIAIEPRRADAHQTLTAALHQLNRLPEAIESAKQVVRLKPLDAQSHYALAQLHLQSQQPGEALGPARRAVELQPNTPALLVCVSRAYLGIRAEEQAVQALDRALSIDPHCGDALIDRGQIFQSHGQLDQAIVAYQAGLKSLPSNRSGLNNLGTCLLLKGLAAESIPFFQAAARVSPHSAKPLSNLGAALKELGQIDQAIDVLQQATAVDPKHADTYCNLGAAYAAIAEHEQSIAACRQTLLIDPNYSGVGSNLLLTLLSPEDISPQQLLDEHLDWDRRHARSITHAAETTPSPRDAGRRLRVGYVSPDFREHSIRYFIEPIFAAHDHSRFEIFAYASGKRRDEVSDRLSGLVDHWHNAAGLDDAQLADLIRSHQIDILIDLAGHTSDNRLLTFARQPARVQITYLGYPATTGMAVMDYRLTDSITDPPGAEKFYSEKLIRLPGAFFVYRDDPAKPFDPVLPADRNGFFTFGSFNSFTKFNDSILSAWANILRAVPRSRLLMKARPMENPSTRQRVLSFFLEQGISADRLDLRAWVTLPEHIALLGSGIDLMLDTFPYNGHTTTCQSLWMGAAAVTRSGDSFRSRVGQTIMQHLNLGEFVAGDWEEYQRIAIAMATDLQHLRMLRPQLRERMIRSPLCDASRFVSGFEQALQLL